MTSAGDVDGDGRAAPREQMVRLPYLSVPERSGGAFDRWPAGRPPPRAVRPALFGP